MKLNKLMFIDLSNENIIKVIIILEAEVPIGWAKQNWRTFK